METFVGIIVGLLIGGALGGPVVALIMAVVIVIAIHCPKIVDDDQRFREEQREWMRRNGK